MLRICQDNLLRCDTASIAALCRRTCRCRGWVGVRVCMEIFTFKKGWFFQGTCKIPVSVRTGHLRTNPWQLLQDELTSPRRRPMQGLLCHSCTVARSTGCWVGSGAGEGVQAAEVPCSDLKHAVLCCLLPSNEPHGGQFPHG